jgi:hypothetical protein
LEDPKTLAEVLTKADAQNESFEAEQHMGVKENNTCCLSC